MRTPCENSWFLVNDKRKPESILAGVLADLDPPRIGPPGPNPLADMDPLPPRSISASGFGPPSADLDPLTKLSKNITIHNFLT